VTHLDKSVGLYSYNNNITFKMAGIPAKTCW